MIKSFLCTYRDESGLTGDINQVELNLDDFVRRGDDVESARLALEAVRSVNVVAGIVNWLDALWWWEIKKNVFFVGHWSQPADKLSFHSKP